MPKTCVALLLPLMADRAPIAASARGAMRTPTEHAGKQARCSYSCSGAWGRKSWRAVSRSGSLTEGEVHHGGTGNDRIGDTTSGGFHDFTGSSNRSVRRLGDVREHLGRSGTDPEPDWV